MKILVWSRFHAFVDHKINATKKLKFALGREKIVGKGENADTKIQILSHIYFVFRNKCALILDLSIILSFRKGLFLSQTTPYFHMSEDKFFEINVEKEQLLEQAIFAFLLMFFTFFF